VATPSPYPSLPPGSSRPRPPPPRRRYPAPEQGNGRGKSEGSCQAEGDAPWSRPDPNAFDKWQRTVMNLVRWSRDLVRIAVWSLLPYLSGNTSDLFKDYTAGHEGRGPSANIRITFCFCAFFPTFFVYSRLQFDGSFLKKHTQDFVFTMCGAR